MSRKSIFSFMYKNKHVKTDSFSNIYIVFHLKHYSSLLLKYLVNPDPTRKYQNTTRNRPEQKNLASIRRDPNGGSDLIQVKSGYPTQCRSLDWTNLY